ncbi:hypothetical protein [Pseudooceanicola sp. MF1-13]|uniref:hypothetical protein n=1 Tax=Pseudooceanicola sp. MF1-13 TaxID=3379095 RepID=UPI0038926276
MPKTQDPNDPKGLIRESFNIEGISDAECRSILMDWALSLPDDRPQKEALAALQAQYGTDAPDHPMTTLLIEGQARLATAGRRGGRAARRH